MSADEDLAQIARQEEELQFDRFDARAAWALGCRLRETAEARGAVLAIDVSLGGQTVFFSLMPGATPNNANWVRRKRNTTQFFQRSSYAIGLQMERDKTDFYGKFALTPADYAIHGGAFPLRVTGVGMVGTVAVSGLPQKEDHGLVVEVLAALLGRSAATGQAVQAR